jgi:DNA polymerase-3 subunit epsilon
MTGTGYVAIRLRSSGIFEMLPLELSRPAVNVDLEATHSDPKVARITQISYEIYHPDGQFEEGWSMVDPGIPIPEESSAIHGITDELIKTGCAICKLPEVEHPYALCEKFRKVPTFAQIAKVLHGKFKDVDWIGFNHKRFDLPLLEEEFRRSEMEFEWRSAAIIDVFRLWQIVEPRTLTDAVERYGYGAVLEGAHDARNDTRGTMLALRGMLKAKPDLPKSLNELAEVLYPRNPNQIDSEFKFIFVNGVPSLNFGQAKGQPMKDNIGFLRWILRNNFSTEVKKIAEDAVNGKFPEFQGESVAS